jgi:hypothetical protein
MGCSTCVVGMRLCGSGAFSRSRISIQDPTCRGLSSSVDALRIEPYGFEVVFSMHDAVCRLRRIPLPRTPVNSAGRRTGARRFGPMVAALYNLATFSCPLRLPTCSRPLITRSCTHRGVAATGAQLRGRRKIARDLCTKRDRTSGIAHQRSKCLQWKSNGAFYGSKSKGQRVDEQSFVDGSR